MSKTETALTGRDRQYTTIDAWIGEKVSRQRKGLGVRSAEEIAMSREMKEQNLANEREK